MSENNIFPKTSQRINTLAVNLQKSGLFGRLRRSFLPQHDPPLCSYFNSCHVPGHLQFLPLCRKQLVGHNFYGPGIILYLEILDNEERYRIKDRAIGGDFFIFIIPRVVKDVLNLGGGHREVTSLYA